MFELYDDDGNGVVDHQELFEIFKNTTHGIAKLMKLDPPQEGFLRQLTKAAFRMADEDNNGGIDPQEFHDWFEYAVPNIHQILPNAPAGHELDEEVARGDLARDMEAEWNNSTGSGSCTE